MHLCYQVAERLTVSHLPKSETDRNVPSFHFCVSKSSRHIVLFSVLYKFSLRPLRCKGDVNGLFSLSKTGYHLKELESSLRSASADVSRRPSFRANRALRPVHPYICFRSINSKIGAIIWVTKWVEPQEDLWRKNTTAMFAPNCR